MVKDKFEPITINLAKYFKIEINSHPLAYCQNTAIRDKIFNTPDDDMLRIVRERTIGGSVRICGIENATDEMVSKAFECPKTEDDMKLLDESGRIDAINEVRGVERR